MFEDESPGSMIKLIDFGLAISFFDSKELKTRKLKTFCGTSYYMAPEVVKGEEYDYLCDLWSAGVILFIMLSGSPPFFEEDDAKVYDLIVKGELNFSDEVWGHIGEEAKDLIKQLLSPSYKRLTAEQALAHPFFGCKLGDK